MNAKNSRINSFAIVFSLLFLIVAMIPISNGKPISINYIYLATMILVMSIFTPFLLWPFVRFWFWLASWLGRVVSPITIGIMFYFIITPCAFVMRLAKKDPMRRSRKHNDNDSYWITRDESLNSNMKDQF